MSSNPNIQRLGNTMFNLLMVDDWLVGLFGNSRDIWRFLEYLGRQLAAGEPVPKEIHVFTVVTTAPGEIEVLETAKIVRTPLQGPQEKEPKDYFIYTAIHEDAEVGRLKEIVQTHFFQISEVLYG